MLNLDNFLVKEKVKDLERRFKKWKKKNNLQEDIWAKEKYWDDLGLIRIKDKGQCSHFSVIKPKEYAKTRELFSTLHELKLRREFKRSQEGRILEQEYEEDLY